MAADAAPDGSAQASKTPSPAAAETSIPSEPIDGNWLADNEGRRYFLYKLPKSSDNWIRLDTNVIGYKPYSMFQLDHEDADAFYVKIYKIEPESATLTRPGPSAEELKRVADSYRANTPPSERLTYSNFGRGLPEAGQWRNGFDIGDMNGDGHPDIVHGTPRKGQGGPRIFLGDGQGGWRLWKEAVFPPAPYDYGAAAVADFNSDGNLDLALAFHLKGLLVLVGDGRGGFSRWSEGIDLQTSPSAVRGFSSRAIVATDWNADKLVDVLALGEGLMLASPMQAQTPESTRNSGNGFVVYRNGGDGSWLRLAGIGKDDIFGDSLAATDLNSDGRLDVVLGSSRLGDQEILRLGQPDGSWIPMVVEPLRPRGYGMAVCAADLDRDGRADLVYAYVNLDVDQWRTGIDVLYARPAGQWERKPLIAEEGRRGVFAISAGDVDGDGHPDLVALTGDGSAWVFLNDGKGGFTREAAPELTGIGKHCRGYHVQLADLDADGRSEIVAAFAGESSGHFGVEDCVDGGSLQAWKAARK